MKRLLLSLFQLYCLIAFTSAAPCSDLKNAAQCGSVQKCVWDGPSTTCKCGDTQADFVFLVDESGSVGLRDFGIQQQFLRHVLDQTIPANSGVGVAKFGSSVRTVITLQNGNNLTVVGEKLDAMSYGSGATHMGDAVRRGMNWLKLSTKPNKIIFLATDGKPNGGTISNPCDLKDEIATTPGLHVVILGVSSGFDKNQVTCLVQKETRPDDWIITVTQYNPQLLDATLPLLDGRFCPEGFQLKITEVKPIPASPGGTTGDQAVFVEMVNDGTVDVPLNKIQMSGLFSGLLAPPSDNTVLMPNQVLVVYQGPTHPQCENCTCANFVPSGPNSPRCGNAIHVACTNANSCRFFGSLAGMNLTNWFVEVYDATSTPPILADSVKYSTSQANKFPVGSLTFSSYELREWGLNNDQGNNWEQSCIPGGTPGSMPLNCSASCFPSRCKSGGDTGANCNGGGTTCTCSGQFYLENGVCLSLFPPAFCTSTLVKIRNATYQVQFAWGTVSQPKGVRYEVNYTRDTNSESKFTEVGNTKEISDQNQALFLSQIPGGGMYGQVRAIILYQPPGTLLEVTIPSIRIPCITQTSAPTPSPTRGTTLLWSYFGGDICSPPLDRCSCSGQQSNCAGAGEIISKKLIGDQRNFLTIKRFPKTYSYDMQIQWVVYDSETNLPLVAPPSTNRRRLASFALPYNTQTCNSSLDICPPWNTTILPGGDISQIALGLNVKRTNKQYYVRITACASTFLADPCIKVFPDQMLVALNGVAPQSSNNVINSNKAPDWLWWLIAGLVLLLVFALLMAYRWWTRNKAISGELDTTKKDLDHAITENELGFGHDLGGDVEFNPMATGVPGQAVVADPYGTEIDGRRQHNAGDRADVAIEKFGYRQQLGQVQQGNMEGGY